MPEVSLCSEESGPFPTLSHSSATGKHLLEAISQQGQGPSIPVYRERACVWREWVRCSLTKVRVLIVHYWERLWTTPQRPMGTSGGHQH